MHPIPHLPRLSEARRAALIVILLWMVVISGCGPAVMRHPVPSPLVDQAEIAGMKHVRVWGDQADAQMQRDWASIAEARRGGDTRVNAQLQPREASPAQPGPCALVISGGGDGGAFGAGVLCGWSPSGTRPEFDVVTGVSTGALIAPMAFLGPGYDARLRDAYTKVSAADILRMRPWLDWLRFDSMADTQPLRERVEKLYPDGLIQEIARQHARGRRLLVQTVNLDAQRPVCWDMGAIASEGTPQAYKLFRQVMVASSSIPAIFPPLYICVEAGGKVYDEMHVDGGTVTQMLLSTIPVNLLAIRREVGPLRQRLCIYALRNGFVRAEYKPVAPRLFPVAARAVSTLIKSQGTLELKLMVHELALADVDLRLAYIPDDYVCETDEQFNRAEMNRLFQRGYRLARGGNPWSLIPSNSLAEPVAGQAAEE